MRVRSTLALCAVAACVPPLYAGEVHAEESTNVEEIVVVASRTPTEAHKVGRSLTVLNEQKIEDLGYNYGADLFRFVPGVAISRIGGYGGQTQLRLRGAEANHVLVLIDGIDVSAAGSGEFDFSSLLSADISVLKFYEGLRAVSMAPTRWPVWSASARSVQRKDCLLTLILKAVVMIRGTEVCR